MDNFKNFIKNNTNLIGYVRDGKKTWQELYELYDLYGEDDNVWSEYLKEDSSNEDTNQKKWSDIVNMAKNIDVDKVQDGINSLQKTLALFSDLFIGKEATSKTYNPRPLYRRFED